MQVIKVDKSAIDQLLAFDDDDDDEEDDTEVGRGLSRHYCLRRFCPDDGRSGHKYLIAFSNLAYTNLLL